MNTKKGLIIAAIFTPMAVTPIPGIASNQYVQVSGVQQLEAEMTPTDRMYVIGDPANIPNLSDYIQAVQNNPNLVLVAVEQSNQMPDDEQHIINVLHNAEVVRSQIISDFTGESDAVMFVRTELNLNDPKPEGGYYGRAGLNLGKGLQDLGITHEAMYQFYLNQRGDGSTVARSISATAQHVAKLAQNEEKNIVETTQNQIEKIGSSIGILEDAIEKANFTPEGYGPALKQTWQSNLAQAQQLLREGNVVGASAEAEEVDKAVSSMIQEVKDFVQSRNARNTAIAAMVVVLLILSIISIFYSKKLREEANEKVDAAKERLGNYINDAITLLDESAYVAIGATGDTKDQANELERLNILLIDQTVALRKFLDEAEEILDNESILALRHRLLPFGAMYVRALANSKVALKFSWSEVETLLDKGENTHLYKERLNRADRAFKLSEVETAYTQSYEKAQALYVELRDSEENLAKAVNDIELSLGALDKILVDLEEFDHDGYFTSLPYLDGVTNPITDKEGGHLAKANEFAKAGDTLKALRDHADVALRMLGDGILAVESSKFGAITLVNAAKTTEGDLGAKGSDVETEWIFQELEERSQALAAVIRKAPIKSIRSLLETEQAQLKSKLVKYQEAFRLNSLRLNGWPEELGKRVTLIAESEIQVLEALQKLSFFKGGQVADIYRESGKSPKSLVAEMTKALQDLQEFLGNGQIDACQNVENKVPVWTAEVDSLVKATEERLAAYGSAVNAIDADVVTANTTDSNLYMPAIETSPFSEFSQRNALQQVGLSATLTLNGTHTKATELVENAISARKDADGLMNKAMILAAGIKADAAQNSINNAQDIFNRLPRAIKALTAAVQSAAQKLQEAKFSLESSTSKIYSLGVRQVTKTKAEKLALKLDSAFRLYQTQPYEALDVAVEVESGSGSIRDGIAADIRKYEAVKAKIAAARSLESAANLAIRTASETFFPHATVSTISATSALNSYKRQISNAEFTLSSENYDKAMTSAESAYRYLSSVPGKAQSAIETARRANQRELDRIEAKKRAEEARKARQAEEVARARDANKDVPYSGGRD